MYRKQQFPYERKENQAISIPIKTPAKADQKGQRRNLRKRDFLLIHWVKYCTILQKCLCIRAKEKQAFVIKSICFCIYVPPNSRNIKKKPYMVILYTQGTIDGTVLMFGVADDSVFVCLASMQALSFISSFGGAFKVLLTKQKNKKKPNARREKY